jgi:hypothetical protein
MQNYHVDKPAAMSESRHMINPTKDDDMKWKDSTTYSRGQRGVMPQTSWSTEVDGVYIFITCAHVACRGSWMIRCHELGIDLAEIGVPDDASSEAARDKAIEMAWSKASILAVKMRGVSDTLFATPNLSEAKETT